LFEAIVTYGRQIPSPTSGILIVDFHGAYSRVGKRETAYFHRDMVYDIVIASSWNDQAKSERNRSWARELFHAIEHHVPHAVYVNGLDQDDGDDRVKQAYGENYTRLAGIKYKYDPTNVFRANKNIRPEATQSAGA
jgi:FAD/FMN-containing dehydrogenase